MSYDLMVYLNIKNNFYFFWMNRVLKIGGIELINKKKFGDITFTIWSKDNGLFIYIVCDVDNFNIH